MSSSLDRKIANLEVKQMDSAFNENPLAFMTSESEAV